jgi:hypothetical protein
MTTTPDERVKMRVAISSRVMFVLAHSSFAYDSRNDISRTLCWWFRRKSSKNQIIMAGHIRCILGFLRYLCWRKCSTYGWPYHYNYVVKMCQGFMDPFNIKVSTIQDIQRARHCDDILHISCTRNWISLHISFSLMLPYSSPVVERNIDLRGKYIFSI